MVLPAIEHADDGHRLRPIVHRIRDHGAPLVVCHPKAGPDVVPCDASVREQRQAFAGGDDRVRVALRDRGRRPFGDVEEQLLELVAGLWSEDDPVRRQALADAFLRAAASRALTAPTPTAREGSTLSLS